MKSRVALALIITSILLGVTLVSYVGFSEVYSSPSESFTLTATGKAYDWRHHEYVDVVLSVIGTRDGKLRTAIDLYAKGGNVHVEDYGVFSVSGGSGLLVQRHHYIKLTIKVTAKYYGGSTQCWFLYGRTGELSGDTVKVWLYSSQVMLPLEGRPRLYDLHLQGRISDIS